MTYGHAWQVPEVSQNRLSITWRWCCGGSPTREPVQYETLAGRKHDALISLVLRGLICGTTDDHWQGGTFEC